LSLASGTRLGPYQIVSQIGAGGMGEVYKAADTRLGRTVAIKVLPEYLVGDQERLARFRREAHAISSLNHPHICSSSAKARCWRNVSTRPRVRWWATSCRWPTAC
jgi:serine/threonine protein kinase